MGVCSFIFGFGFAFYWGWLLTCIYSVIFPLMMCLGGIMAATYSGGAVASNKAYAQSAGYAEQALQAVKVVHTYGNEKLEYNNYVKYLQRAKEQAHKQSIFASLALSSLFTLIFLFYCYGFYLGGYLRWNKFMNGNDLYTGG